MSREEEPVSPGLPPMIRRILWINGGVYLAQHVLWRQEFAAIESYLALSWAGLLHGMVWQLFTYMFLHANLTHVLMNMMGLYFMGPETERTLGSRRFLLLYVLSGVLGGIGFVLLNSRSFCVGASGAVYGVLGAFAALHPNRRMALLIFPFITFRAWVMVLLYAVIEFLSAVGRPYGGVAHTAHLAGGIAGWFFARSLGARPFRWPRQKFDPYGTPGRDTEEAAVRDVDRILDKISREGLHRLSSKERETLERASRRRTDST